MVADDHVANQVAALFRVLGLGDLGELGEDVGAMNGLDDQFPLQSGRVLGEEVLEFW